MTRRARLEARAGRREDWAGSRTAKAAAAFGAADMSEERTGLLADFLTGSDAAAYWTAETWGGIRALSAGTGAAYLGGGAAPLLVLQRPATAGGVHGRVTASGEVRAYDRAATSEDAPRSKRPAAAEGGNQ